MTPQGKVIMDEIIEEALVSFSAELIRNKAIMTSSSSTADLPAYTSYPITYRADSNAPVRFLPWDVPNTLPSYNNPQPFYSTVTGAQQWLPSDIILNTSAKNSGIAAAAVIDNSERIRVSSDREEKPTTKKQRLSGGRFSRPTVKYHNRENPTQMINQSHCQLCFDIVPDIPSSSRCLACHILYCSQEHRMIDLSHHSSVCGIDIDSIHITDPHQSCAACGSVLPNLKHAAKCKRCETYYCHTFHLTIHKELHREACEKYILSSGDFVYKILQTSAKPFPVRIPAKRLEAKTTLTRETSPQREISDKSIAVVDSSNNISSTSSTMTSSDIAESTTTVDDYATISM